MRGTWFKKYLSHFSEPTMWLDTHNERLSVNFWKKKKKNTPKDIMDEPTDRFVHVSSFDVLPNSKHLDPKSYRVSVFSCLVHSRSPSIYHALTSQALVNETKWGKDSLLNLSIVSSPFLMTFPIQENLYILICRMEVTVLSCLHRRLF